MISQVRPAELAHWIESVQQFGTPLVLDVREPHEWQMASVKPDGFVLRTMPMRSVAARLVELDPAQPIACLCHHGMRSMQVASFLQSQGFMHVANISGGIHAWSAELDPSIVCY